MGYAYYEISRFDSGHPMKRGYGVSCKCHQRGCRKEIDRGLAYLCYNCGWYFCGDHQGMAFCEKHDEALEVECFAGESSQVCKRCEKLLEDWDKKYPCEQHEELETEGEK